MRAKAGHQKGTKLVTPGMKRISVAGSEPCGGELIDVTKARTIRDTTENITKKHSQIENSPYILQNFLFLDMRSRKTRPLVVLIIRIMPATLSKFHLFRNPEFSRYISRVYHSASPIISPAGSMFEYTPNAKTNTQKKGNPRVSETSPSSPMNATAVPSYSTCVP